MKSLILYDSVFGNTEKIAQSLGDALAAEGTSSVVKSEAFSPEALRGIDLLIIGSPTRAFKPTPAITNLVRGLDPRSIADIPSAVFDTRIALEDINVRLIRFIQSRIGGAAGVMAKMLSRRGISPITEPESFCVLESEGPLKEGELDRAVLWASMLIHKAKGGEQ